MPIINSKIPNMDGFILTVAGPITPDNLGNTLMHEHLFLDLDVVFHGSFRRSGGDI